MTQFRETPKTGYRALRFTEQFLKPLPGDKWCFWDDVENIGPEMKTKKKQIQVVVEPPTSKIWSSNWESFPQVGVKIKKCLKPPSSGGIPNSIEKKYNHDESVCTIVYSNEKENARTRYFLRKITFVKSKAPALHSISACKKQTSTTSV